MLGIIFSIQNLLQYHFGQIWSYEVLTAQRRYVYLGITFTSNGKFTKAIVGRVNKASRAIFIVRKAITTAGNVNVYLACNIFDKQIQPIMIYGCPIWGLPCSNMCLYLDNIPNNIPVLDIKNSLQNLNYKIEMCRRVGKQTLNSRPI